jgi:hypothetical protein
MDRGRWFALPGKCGWMLSCIMVRGWVVSLSPVGCHHAHAAPARSSDPAERRLPKPTWLAPQSTPVCGWPPAPPLGCSCKLRSRLSPLVSRRRATQGERCFPVHFPASFAVLPQHFPGTTGTDTTTGLCLFNSKRRDRQRRRRPTGGTVNCQDSSAAVSRGWRAVQHWLFGLMASPSLGVCVTAWKKTDGAVVLALAIAVRSMLIRGDISCQTRRDEDRETETRPFLPSLFFLPEPGVTFCHVRQ